MAKYTVYETCKVIYGYEVEAESKEEAEEKVCQGGTYDVKPLGEIDYDVMGYEVEETEEEEE